MPKAVRVVAVGLEASTGDAMHQSGAGGLKAQVSCWELLLAHWPTYPQQNLRVLARPLLAHALAFGGLKMRSIIGCLPSLEL